MTHRYEVLTRDGEGVQLEAAFDNYRAAAQFARELAKTGQRPIILPVSVREAG